MSRNGFAFSFLPLLLEENTTTCKIVNLFVDYHECRFIGMWNDVSCGSSIILFHYRNACFMAYART